MRALIAICLVAAASAVEPAWSAPQSAEIAARERGALRVADGWQVRTPNYRVLAQASARLAAEVASYVELAHATVLGELDLELRERVPCDVVVYATRAAYRAAFGPTVNSRGRFDWHYADEHARPTFLIATWQGDARRGLADLIPILTHETTHHVLQAAAGRRHIPWLVQEGVATFFQTWDLFRDAEWNHANHRGEFRRELARACDHGHLPSLPSLARLEVWDADGFGPVTNTRYGCAESIVGFLLCDAARRPFARRLIDAALDGGDVARLLADGEGARLEAAWRAWLVDHHGRESVAGHEAGAAGMQKLGSSAGSR